MKKFLVLSLLVLSTHSFAADDVQCKEQSPMTSRAIEEVIYAKMDAGRLTPAGYRKIIKLMTDAKSCDEGFARIITFLASR